MKNDTYALTLLLNKEIRLKKNLFTLLFDLAPFEGIELLITAKSQFK